MKMYILDIMQNFFNARKMEKKNFRYKIIGINIDL